MLVNFFEGLEFNNSILISIIAINLTLIGLTSLAESKKVMGIDYGKFLVNEFVIFLPFNIKLKLKHWLGFFILVNGLAIMSLFFTKYIYVVIVLSFVLSFCLITLLAYFFFFILQVNRKVKKQIYIKTFSSMYTSLNEKNKKGEKRSHSYFDTKLDISDGAPTKKRIVSSVYRYFDEDSHEVQEVFEDVFSKSSVIYNPKEQKNKKIVQYFIQQYNNHEKMTKKSSNHSLIVEDREINNPYNYRFMDGCYDISHEFFQMVRNTKLQARWCMSMFYLSKEEKTCNFFTYSNIVRITCNLGLYGNSEDISNYKFIQFLMREYIKSVSCDSVVKEEYKKRIDNVLHPFNEKDEKSVIDYAGVETDYLMSFFNIAFKAVVNYIDENLLRPIEEIKLCFQKIIDTDTKLSVDAKKVIFEETLKLFEINHPSIRRTLNLS
ncbi:MAG TPA: hypothetical protein VJZ51_00760 [Bacilli bacterium]|nr:hypothetical protein [Bacilli bacterium]